MGAQLCVSEGPAVPVSVERVSIESTEGLFDVTIVRDATALRNAETGFRRMEATAHRAIAELEQFAYIVSHDLQEPMRAIAGSCQLPERRVAAKLDENERTFLSFAVDGARRMQTLMSELLDYSRFTTRRKPPVPTDCDALVRSILASHRHDWNNLGAEVTHDALPTVHAGDTQLARVFEHLIANGIKFRRGDSVRVHISAARNGSDWTSSVQDSGIGIDPKHTEKIFAIFRRLHPGDEFPGTGMGLAVCKRIVERRGGRI